MHAQLARHRVTVRLSEDAAVCSRDLGGAVHRQVEDVIRLGDRESEHLAFSDADQSSKELAGEGGLTEALRPSDHQRLTTGPQDVISNAPDGRDALGTVEDEARAVDEREDGCRIVGRLSVCRVGYVSVRIADFA
ncbi:hypothetical protein GS909_23885 [Rhodococcus hoagii]|nr:hypothetical protein [Prescottella equi]